MTTDDLEAAWAAVHDAPPEVARLAGYDAAMRVARWRWVLVLMVVLIAGCLPQSTPDLPAEIHRAFEAQGMTFQASAPAADAMTAGVALRLIREHRARPFLGQEPLGPAIYGLASCVDADRCARGPSIGVWLIRFPGQQPNVAPPKPDEWIVVNAVTGDALFSVGR